MAEALVGQTLGLSLEEGEPLPQPLAELIAAGEPSGRVDAGDGSLLLRHLHSDGRTILVLDDAGQALSLQALGELGLTPREAAVLHELARGAEPETVAIKLGIAPRTVDKHTQRVHTELGVGNRAQAVATAWAAVVR